MTICIYHGNCADGFGAAMALYRYAKKNLFEVEFIKGVYGEPPPDVKGRSVIMLDFSYKRPVLVELAKKAEGILILDHHKSAEEDLREGNPIFRIPSEYNRTDNIPWNDTDIFAQFDMNRSGAGIAWDFYFPNQPRPKLIDHIEDQDLWRFNLSKSREISAALFSYEYDFKKWDELIDMFEVAPDLLIEQGEALERKHHKDIRELLGQTKRHAIIGGFSVPVANLPYTMSSDAGHLLAVGEPFGACYFDKTSGRYFSLRSTDNGQDVSIIAKQYGGGGHRNAAGFELPWDRVNEVQIY